MAISTTNPISPSMRYTACQLLSPPPWRSALASWPANTMPMPIPIPTSPAARPRRCGGSTIEATHGDGIQIAAPPSPMAISAIASTPPLPAAAASSRPAVDSTRPPRISVVGVNRVDSEATTIVPARYAATLAVPSRPAAEFEPPSTSSRTDGSSAP